MKQTWFFLIFIVSYGCSDFTEDYLKITYEGQDTLYTDSIRYFGFSEAEVDTFIKRVDYVYLESKEGYYLERISKLILTDEYLFIGQFYENSGVFIFDQNGALITSISDFGKGPGEVSNITDFVIDEVNQLIYVGEGGNRRVSVFQFDGVFKKSEHVGFSFYKMAYSPEEMKYIFYTPHDHDPAEGSRIKLTDASFNILSKAFPVDSDKSGLFFGFENRFYEDDQNQVYFNPLFENEIYQIRYDGSIQGKFAFEGIESGDFSFSDLINDSQPEAKKVREMNLEMPVERFSINSERMCVRINRDKHPYVLMADLESGKKKMYKPTIKLTEIGRRFDFVFLEPKSIYRKKLVGYLDAESYLRLLEAVDDEDATAHLRRINIFDNPVIVLYEMNEGEILENTSVQND